MKQVGLYRQLQIYYVYKFDVIYLINDRNCSEKKSRENRKAANFFVLKGVLLKIHELNFVQCKIFKCCENYNAADNGVIRLRNGFPPQDLDIKGSCV